MRRRRQPLGPADRGFLSAGTWFLVGVERPQTDTSETARTANFSNEPGRPAAIGS